jgi:hypothetical protein
MIEYCNKFRNFCYKSISHIKTCVTTHIRYFRIDATYEMRTTEYGEICISIDDQTNPERVFMRNRKMGKESKVMERQRAIECVCVSVDQNR